MNKKMNLFVGNDIFLIKKKISFEMKKREIEEKEIINQYWSLENEKEIADLFVSLASKFFFKVKKIVLNVNNFSKLKKETRNTLIERLKESKNLIFLWFNSKNNKKINLKELQEIVEIKVLKSEKKEIVIQNFLEKNKVFLNEETESLLLRSMPDNREWLENELQKILIFYLKNRDLSANNLKKIVCNYEEDLIFPLMEAIIEGDEKRIVNSYLRVNDQQKDPFYIVSILENYVLNLKKILAFRKKRYSTMQVAQIIKKKYFFVLKLERLSAKIKGEEINILFDKIINLKYLTRRVKLDKKTILEIFLLTLK